MSLIHRRRSMFFFSAPRVGAVFAALAVLPGLVACSSATPPTPSGGGVTADQVEIVHGVPARGDDPAVVAIDIGEQELCSGALIAPDVVLTARHCVSLTTTQVSCPVAAGSPPQVTGDRRPDTLAILVGDDVATASLRAHGAAIVTPPTDSLCDADIALIVLDQPIDGIAPLEVRTYGIAQGDHVRSVGFGRSRDGAPAGVKLLRDHVLVTQASAAEFLVGQATCQGDSGGPALDETTGQIVGVVSRGGPTCDGKGAHNVYTRSDAFLALIEETLAQGAPPVGMDAGVDAAVHHRDAGARAHRDGGKAPKPKPDFGATCQRGSDCAAGVCVTDQTKQYCSRACAPHDRCPAHFRCQKANGGPSVCVEH